MSSESTLKPKRVRSGHKIFEYGAVYHLAIARLYTFTKNVRESRSTVHQGSSQKHVVDSRSIVKQACLGEQSVLHHGSDLLQCIERRQFYANDRQIFSSGSHARMCWDWPERK